MIPDLRQVRQWIEHDPRLDGFEVRREGEELHLEKGGDSFARLIRGADRDAWRIELFRATEGWEILDFTGSLEECLEFLTDHPHYLFWER